MKRIILTSVSLAALAIATPALADNSVSTITQDRSAGLAGDARTTTANVDQSGPRGSTSTISQLDALEAPVNVTQTDNGSGGDAIGHSNDSSVRQENASGGSNVTVNQNKNLFGERNSSVVDQGRNAFNSDISVAQTGADNVATVDTRDTDGTLANVNQNGLANTAYVQQDFQQGSQAYVDQTGNGAGPNSVQIQQIAAGFSTTPASFGNGNFAQATQNGSNLRSNILQSGGGLSHFARTNQTGDDQSSNISQTGSDGSADVIQSGSSHESNINQTGTDNRAYVEQRNTNNLSNIDQSGTDTYGQVIQTGSNNQSFLTQSGANQDAFVTQSSNNNVSSINQTATSSNSTAVVNQH